MKVKIIWLICSLVVFILVWQLIVTTNVISHAKTSLAKKIAGESLNLPQPDRKALVRPPEKSSEAGEPQIAAKTAILVDIDSAYVMYEQKSDEEVPMASTTKIMTALVVLEDFGDKLNETVTITYPMVAVKGSDIKLIPGEKISVECLLKGLLIMSGNDTAFALALHFGGKEAFVSRMNAKARQLGLLNTHFADPAGLDDEGFSTARELAILGTYAMRNQNFRQIVNTTETQIASADGTITHELESSNRLLKPAESFFYPWAIGIKTGFTNEAGHCLVSAAEKEDHEILGVILYTYENSIYASARESRKLLDWGLANWTWN